MASRNAHAYPFYFDVQGGTGEYLGTSDPLFNSGAAGSTSLGLDLTFGLFYTPIEPRGGFDFQIGLENWYMSTSQGTGYFSTFAPYGVVRLQLWMFYATAGISPLVWRRNQISPGFDVLSQAPSTLAYLTEAGMLYPATPKFSMGLSVAAQWFSSSGVLSSQAGATINFVMRFYFNLFGVGQDGPTQAAPLEFQGWRYIGK